MSRLNRCGRIISLIDLHNMKVGRHLMVQPVCLSVIVPSFNRSAAVSMLVEKLNEYSSDDFTFEIIVVLDGSTDNSVNRLSEIEMSSHAQLRVIEQKNQGRAAARNRGIESSLGTILLFLDDDVLPETSIITQHIRAHERLDAVLGKIIHPDVPGDSRLMRDISKEYYSTRHRRLSAPDAQIVSTDVFAGHLSVKADLIRKVGGFDPTFTGYGCEDWDLGQRLIQTGARFGYLGEAEVSHHSLVDRRRWIKNAEEEAVSQLILTEKHPTLAPSIEIGGLYESSILGRSTAYAAMYSPKASRIAGGALFEAGRLTHAVGLRPVSHRLVAQSSRVMFWSSLANRVGSVRDTHRQFAFHARVLCYHRVTDDPNPALHEWAVRPVDLREQMQYLAEQGFEAVTCAELIRRFRNGIPLDRVVAITFDDGYLDTVTTAAPILTEYGFVATVFAVSGQLGLTAEWDSEYGGEMARLATSAELNSLVELGWEIGHHTASHPALPDLDQERLVNEVQEGWSALANIIRAPVTTFAYPFAIHDASVRAFIAACDFVGTFAVGSRFASPRSNPQAIERVFILDSHSLHDFKLLLWIGHDRLSLANHVISTPGRILKRLRAPDTLDSV